MKRTAVTVFIIFLAFFAGFLAFQLSQLEKKPQPLDLVLMKARIAPIGEVNIQSNVPVSSAPATTTASTGNKGKEIYETKCILCHENGVAGAPKFGDAAAWKPRLAKGLDTLFHHAKEGFNAMPPKGTCTECTDDDLKAAINYMTSHGGG